MEDLDQWRQRRFGLFLQANLASVPAWAPIGLDASCYLSYLEDVDLNVEVAAHHQSRWDHLGRTADFLELLHFDSFNPEHWVELAEAVGVSYLVQVAKDSDGLCWWDAPGADFHVCASGPRRDVVQEVATACQRAGLAFGTAYALTDTDDPNTQLAQIHDLVERVGSSYLLGTSDLDNDSFAELNTLHSRAIFNDAWGKDHPDRTTYLRVPDSIVSDRSWELICGLGAGRGHNRIETAQHRRTPFQVVALLTEVLAKGGNLLLAVGVGADGRIPEQQAVALRSAGGWIKAHSALIHNSEPWELWGDHSLRYLHTGQTDPDKGECLWVIDLSQRGEFPALGISHGKVTEITLERDDREPLVEITWEQRAEGLHIQRSDRSGFHLGSRTPHRDADPAQIAVYRVWLRQPEPEPNLFDTSEFSTTQSSAETHKDLSELLHAAQPGSVIHLGDATYLGAGRIPDGVTIRGLGPNRSHILTDPSAPLEMGTGSRIEFAHIVSTDAPHRSPHTFQPLIQMTGSGSVLLSLRVEGAVHITGSDHILRGSELRTVLAVDTHALTVARCQLRDIKIVGGAEQHIESSEFTGDQAAIICENSAHLLIRGNSLAGYVWGIRILNCEAPHIMGNSIRSTTRAVEIAGGSGAVVDANAVSEGDSGCVIHQGATGVVISGNHWQNCRIGLMIHGDGEVIHHSNAVVGLLEPEHAVMLVPG